MRIDEMLGQGRTLSFEFFPPKTDKGRERLRQTVQELEPLKPSFVSVTYGAGGSTQARTREVVEEIECTTSLTAMPHLTCIAATREELRAILTDYGDRGVRNILALHGDPPRDNPDLEAGEVRRAAELVELVRETGDFSVGVATHPEGHPKAPDALTDRRHQAAKLREADFGITQFFFDAKHYHKLVDDLDALGVDTPIIAGVIPVTDAKQAQRFAELSGAAFPEDLARRLEAVADDPEQVRAIGVEVATELCQELVEAGAPGIHVYTLNRSTATLEVLDNLGVTVG